MKRSRKSPQLQTVKVRQNFFRLPGIHINLHSAADAGGTNSVNLFKRLVQIIPINVTVLQLDGRQQNGLCGFP